MTRQHNHNLTRVPVGKNVYRREHPITPGEWSVNWWRGRHDQGYFPTMEQHLDWKIQDGLPSGMEGIGLQPDDEVLEIGCGYGEWMIPVSRLVKSVHGIDLHESLHAKAIEKFAEHGVTNAEFVLCDGLSIPFAASRFSVVFANAVFQHIPRATVRTYFEETYRVLRPGGRVLFHFRLADGIGPYSEDIAVDHTGDFSVGWSESEVKAEADRVGFSCKISAGGDTLLMIGRKT